MDITIMTAKSLRRILTLANKWFCLNDTKHRWLRSFYGRSQLNVLYPVLSSHSYLQTRRLNKTDNIWHGLRRRHSVCRLPVVLKVYISNTQNFWKCLHWKYAQNDCTVTSTGLAEVDGFIHSFIHSFTFTSFTSLMQLKYSFVPRAMFSRGVNIERNHHGLCLAIAMAGSFNIGLLRISSSITTRLML